jgi:hypothetical protein
MEIIEQEILNDCRIRSFDNIDGARDFLNQHLSEKKHPCYLRKRSKQALECNKEEFGCKTRFNFRILSNKALVLSASLKNSFNTSHATVGAVKAKLSIPIPLIDRLHQFYRFHLAVEFNPIALSIYQSYLPISSPMTSPLPFTLDHHRLFELLDKKVIEQGMSGVCFATILQYAIKIVASPVQMLDTESLELLAERICRSNISENQLVTNLVDLSGIQKYKTIEDLIRAIQDASRNQVSGYNARKSILESYRVNKNRQKGRCFQLDCSLNNGRACRFRIHVSTNEQDLWEINHLKNNNYSHTHPASIHKCANTEQDIVVLKNDIKKLNPAQITQLWQLLALKNA